jgi:O-acetyl-ADP-ribose deacetylase (regulator of RNase III)
MDGGIDYALSRIIFPGIESDVRNIVKEMGIKTIVGRPYLPIGSSIILDRDNKSLVISPTMLLPQNVSATENAYYATIAVLYNILVNRRENLDDIDIIFTSLCCGYGKMSEDVSIQQCVSGIRNYKNYNPIIINDHIILNEPNLEEQPKYYQNTEFFLIEAQDIINC